MEPTDDIQTQGLSPGEVAERRIEKTRQFVHKYLVVGIFVGLPFNLLLLAQSSLLATIGFLFVSLIALASVPGLAHIEQPKVPTVILGMWMGNIIGFMIGLMYVLFIESSLLEVALGLQ